MIAILSLTSGRYTTLRGRSVDVWRGLIAGGSPRAMLESQHPEGEVRHGQPSLSDVDAVVRQFVSRGLIVPATSVPPEQALAFPLDRRRAEALASAPVRGCPSVLACWLLLIVARAALAVAGFYPVFRVMQRLVPAERYRMDDGTLKRLSRRVAVAQAILPIRTTCLENSLSTWWMLRRAGAQARFRIGVHPYPFSAHAWVEHGTMPVVHDLEMLRRHRAFPAIDSEALRDV
jgi:hypothetical protein